MNDEMTADLKDATDFDENAAIASFDEIVAAKTEQIDARWEYACMRKVVMHDARS